MPMRSPSPDLLQLGRGIVRWAPIVAGVQGPFFDLGNVEQLTIATADTKLTKKSSRVAANVVYKEITSERDVTVTIQGDEFDAVTVAAILQGEREAVDETAGDTEAAEAITRGVAVGELGITLELAHPLVSSVVLKTVTGGAVTYDEVDPVTGDGDYEVIDAARGLVYIRTAAEGGTITAAKVLTADYTWGKEVAHERILGGTKSVIEGTIEFAADNAQGENRDATFYRASITSDGELGFISTEFATWTMKAKLLDDSAGHFGGSVACPLYVLRSVPAAGA